MYYITMTNKIIKSILLANIDVNEFDPVYRRVVLVNIVLIAIALGFSIFIFINLFLFVSYITAFFDTIALLITIYAIYDIRKTKQITRAAFIASSNFAVFLLILMLTKEGDEFTLIWTIFLPIIAIFTNGSKKGLLISSVFYIFAFSIAYSGTGSWQDGAWSTAAFSRFLMASIILVYVLYLFEQSFEKAFLILNKTRKKELEYVNQLQVCSITDPLTTLFNRRQLDYLFDKNFDKARENRSYFAFFILDLDFFKQYNDSYGHVAGDEVLKNIATVLTNNMKREVDNVFRLGGEEFSGLIMADSSDKIFKSVEKIRSDIQNLRIAHKSSEHEFVTASFGICIINDFTMKDFDKMYSIADNLLYKAKNNGRNCIVGDVVSLDSELRLA